MKKRAYISVYNKTDIEKLALRLQNAGWEIVSTGNTANYLINHGINVVESSSITGFSELLGGKVKSLHPKIFAPILADETEIKALDCEPFSLVVVNLYPFKKYKGVNADIDVLTKNIDIGGVALLRAAAKNFKNVTVICDTDDYDVDFENVDETTRQKLALKAFETASKYDYTIYNELSYNFGFKNQDELSDLLALYLEKKNNLRYGENPHQSAALYNYADELDYEILNGKEMSYNNILDATASLNIACEFYDVCACVIVKHTNPCAVALGKDLEDAWKKALDCDPLSAFGGIVAFTRQVDSTLAKHLTSMFLEIVIAPSYTDEALEILKTKKNLRVVKINTPYEKYHNFVPREIKLTPFGALVQEKDTLELDIEKFKVVTKLKPTQEQVEDMVFAFKVAKHVKSNAIVVAKDLRTLGICGGQTSRVGAVEIAINRVCDSPKNAVLASDGFFPAIDNIHLAAQNRIAAIIQPAGSIKDKEVIETADKMGIIMIATGIRHFRH